MICTVSESKPNGWEPFLKFLEQLPTKCQREVLTPGIRAEAAVMRKIAQDHAPVGHHEPIKTRKSKKVRLNGYLQKSITTYTKQWPGGPAVYVAVGAFYGRFLEYGTKFMQPTHWLTHAYFAADPDSMLQRMLESMARGVYRLAQKGGYQWGGGK